MQELPSANQNNLYKQYGILFANYSVIKFLSLLIYNLQQMF